MKRIIDRMTVFVMSVWIFGELVGLWTGAWVLISFVYFIGVVLWANLLLLKMPPLAS